MGAEEIEYLHKTSCTRMLRLSNRTSRKYSDLRDLNNIPVARYSRITICPESRSAEAGEHVSTAVILNVSKDAAYWYSPGTIVDPLAYLPSHQYLSHALRGRLYRGNEKISSWLCRLGSK